MKTLEYFKNEVAKEKGHDDFPEIWIEDYDNLNNQAAKRYAAYAFELACNLTKEKCAEEAKATYYTDMSKAPHHREPAVDKDSILNCESPTNPFTLIQ